MKNLLPWSDEIESLYGHWVNCIDIWEFSYKKITIKENDIFDKRAFEALSKMQNFYRLAISYALLYVVIEGYQELNLRHKKIDTLLVKKELVGSLRKLRNAVFHYQKQPIPPKLMEFIKSEDSAIWANKVKIAFHKYFTANLPIQEIINITKTATANQKNSE